MSRLANCATNFLLLWNICFAVVALGCATVGGVYEYSFFPITPEYMPDRWTSALMIVCYASLVLFLVAALGILGSIYENRCLLILYAITLAITWVSSLLLFLYFTFLDDGRILTVITNRFYTSMKDYGHVPLVTNTWDALHSDFGCCGLQGIYDFTQEDTQIPHSCCYNLPTTEDCTPHNAYKVGCIEKIKSGLSSIFDYLVIGFAVFSLVQLFCFWCTFFLMKSLKEDVKKRDEAQEKSLYIENNARI